MFLLMRILCGRNGPPLGKRGLGGRRVRTRPVPHGRAVAGSHCPAVRLDDLGELRSEGSSEQGERQGTRRQSRSASHWGRGTRPPTARIVAAPAGKAPPRFLLYGPGSPERARATRAGPRPRASEGRAAPSCRSCERLARGRRERGLVPSIVRRSPRQPQPELLPVLG